MKLKKKELIVSVIIIIAFLFIGMNLDVLATSGGNVLNMDWPSLQNSNTNSEMMETGNTGKDSEAIPQINTNRNSTNNNPGQLANTGLEEWPWAIIAVCAVSTVFAYKKIKEYKEA